MADEGVLGTPPAGAAATGSAAGAASGAGGSTAAGTDAAKTSADAGVLGTPPADKVAADAKAAADAAAQTAADAAAKATADKAAADKAAADKAAEVDYSKVAKPKDGAIDDKALEALRAFAKEQKMPLDAAQKMVDAHNQLMVTAVEGARQQLKDAATTKWPAELKADKDFGGANFDANAENARMAVEKFGGADLRDALAKSGYGNFPPLVKAFANIGKAMREGGFIHSNQPAINPLDAMFPTTAAQRR